MVPGPLEMLMSPTLWRCRLVTYIAHVGMVTFLGMAINKTEQNPWGVRVFSLLGGRPGTSGWRNVALMASATELSLGVQHTPRLVVEPSLWGPFFDIDSSGPLWACVPFPGGNVRGSAKAFWRKGEQQIFTADLPPAVAHTSPLFSFFPTRGHECY